MQEYHADTEDCYDLWVKHLGLGPHHTSGYFEDNNKASIDLYVRIHGKKRVLEALICCKTRTALQALSVIDTEEMHNAREKVMAPKVDQAEVQRLMGEM